MMVASYNGYYNENTSVSSAFTPVVVNSYSRLHAYPRTFHLLPAHTRLHKNHEERFTVHENGHERNS